MEILIVDCELRGYEFRDRKDNNGQYLIIRFEDKNGIQHNAIAKDNSIIDSFEKGLKCDLLCNLYVGSDYARISLKEIK